MPGFCSVPPASYWPDALTVHTVPEPVSIDSGDNTEAAGLIPAQLTASRAIDADSEPENWLLHGRTYNEQRFSPLDKINNETVKDLGLAWFHKTVFDRGLEATPIVVDGVMYVTGAWSMVYAFNAKNGQLIWSYDPKVPGDWAAKGCCGVVNRGVARLGRQSLSRARLTAD